MLYFSVFFFIAAFLFAVYIRKSYKRFCQMEDMKERIEILKKKIFSARTYLRENYNTPESSQISKDIIPKIEFLVKLIEKTDINHQEEKFNLLLNLTTETLFRIKTDFYNVPAILSPLNTLRDQLVQDHIDFLRKYSEEET